MNATLRTILLATLPVAIFAPGCLHHYPVAREASGLLTCETRPGESACYESSRFDDRGMLRHHVVERTTPGGSCDLVTIEQSSFDASGVLIERVAEDRRCRVVDRRVTTRYDLERGVVEHRVERDDNHDDQMDQVRSTSVAMNERVRVLALTTGRERMVHLTRSMATQRGVAPHGTPLIATTAD